MSTHHSTHPKEIANAVTGEPIVVEELIRRSQTKLLFPDDLPVVASRYMAEEIGLDNAVILQQLHFLLRNKRNGKLIEGKRWIYNTYEQWIEDHFPWMSLMTIRRRFRQLETEGWIESCQPEGRISRRKYYRLSDELMAIVAKMQSEQNEPSTCSTGTRGKGSE